jgi:hypothetical protein
VSRFTADAAALCERAPNAKAVTYGGESARGPVDIEDRMEQDAGGERLVRRTIVTIGRLKLPSVVRSSLPLTIVVDEGLTTETSYKVRDIEYVEDGELKELICAEA